MSAGKEVQVSNDETGNPPNIEIDPAVIADFLNAAFEKNRLQDIVHALRLVIRSQNVKALSEDTGMRRDGLYKTFNGKKDPQLSRILKLFNGLNLRIVVKALPPKVRAPRPKLGRPTSMRR
jgi:probable addiction module antidote protein